MVATASHDRIGRAGRGSMGMVQARPLVVSTVVQAFKRNGLARPDSIENVHALTSCNAHQVKNCRQDGIVESGWTRPTDPPLRPQAVPHTERHHVFRHQLKNTARPTVSQRVVYLPLGKPETSQSGPVFRRHAHVTPILMPDRVGQFFLATTPNLTFAMESKSARLTAGPSGPVIATTSASCVYATGF